MELRDFILNYRRENKISQRELARRAGLSNSLISIIENGINPQTGKKMVQDLGTYKKLADAMGMSINDLIDKIDDAEIVSLKSTYRDLAAEPIIIPDSEMFVNIVRHMEPSDYETVMEIYDKTYKRMKKQGLID